MTQLAFDFPTVTTGIVHAVMPNFALACGIGLLDKPAGDTVTFTANNWADVTCPWCHSLGHDYYRAMCARAQRNQAA